MSETSGGNGSQTAFSFPFVAPDTGDISAIYTDASGNITDIPPNEISISLNAAPVGGLWPIGGTLTYPLSGSPIASGTTLTIERILPLTQVTSLDNQGNQYPAAIEAALDKLCMQIQQVNQTAQLSLQIPVTDTQGTGVVLPSAQLRANNILAFDAMGTPIVISAASIAGGGLSYYDNLTLVGSEQASPVAYVSLTASGPDSHIGINYNSKGTVTTGSQFNGNTTGSGDHFFKINGANVLQLDDTYWNPNDSYEGAPTAWPVISSGALAGGPDNIAVISCNSSIYPGTATGVSLIIGAKGPSGQIHFVGNGWLGHVTISPPITNPNGNDAYGVPNSLTLSGTAAASNSNPSIVSTESGNASDAAIGMTFYNRGTGSFIFSTGNTNRNAFQIDHVPNFANNITIVPAVTGANPSVYAGGPAGNIRLTLSGSDDAGVDICNRLGTFPIAKFSAGFEPADGLQVLAQGASSGPILYPFSTGANSPMNISSLGNSSIIFYTADTAQAQLEIQSSGLLKFRNSASSTANGVVATVLGSLGPTGSHTAVQEWLTYVNSAGTTRYLPAF